MKLTPTILNMFSNCPPTDDSPQAVAVPVLAVRMKLRAKEEPRLELKRQALIVEEEQAKKRVPTTPSYLKPLNKRVNEKSLAEPPPRLLLLKNLQASRYNSARRLAGGTGARSAPRGRSSNTENVKTANRGTARRFGRSHSHHSARGGRVQSASHQVARRRSKSRDRGAWGRARSAVRASSSSSQRQLGRGRSASSASRKRGGASRSWMGHHHLSKRRSSSISSSRKGRSARLGNKTSRNFYPGGNRRSNNNSTSSVSPRRPIWPAMSTLAHVTQPSRLKLRG